jgi:hypothetical protein
MGASALPDKADWTWVTDQDVPREFQPPPVDTDKRRGALLSARNDNGFPVTATPVSEKHAFLIEWDSPE